MSVKKAAFKPNTVTSVLAEEMGQNSTKLFWEAQ